MKQKLIKLLLKEILQGWKIITNNLNMSPVQTISFEFSKTKFFKNN